MTRKVVRAALTVGTLLAVSSYGIASPSSDTLGADQGPSLGERQLAPPGFSREEIEAVLPLFLKFSETRQLAAALEASIERGDLAAAKNLIEQAVETSTFAVLAADWLKEPLLVRMLHDRGIHNAATAVADIDVGELKKALHVERERREALERENAALKDAPKDDRQSEHSNAAFAAEANGFREALERERELSANLAKDNSALAEKLTSLESGQVRDAAEVAKLREALDREYERSQLLARDYEAAREELTALQAIRDRHAAATAELADLKRELEVEQTRSLSLARDHATLIQKLAGTQFTHSIANQGTKDAPPVPDSRVALPAAKTSTSPAIDLRIVPALPANPLVTRAEALFRSGDVSGARLLLARASEAGDPAATFLLAETFDPRALSRLGVIGVRGDSQKAEELYARARALRGGQEEVLAAPGK
jgi:hypothetical protein